MKKLLSLLLIISMISTGAIATFAETVNEDVVISDVVENIEINEEEVSEEVAEEDAAVDVANEDVEATEVVEDVVEVDEEKSEVEEVTEAEDSDDLKDEEIGEIVLVPMKEDSSNNETTEVEEDETEAEEELLGASNQVTVTIDPQNSIPHKGLPYNGNTKKYTIKVKKGSSLDDNDLYPNKQAMGYSEKKEDVKKYNFSNLVAGGYSYIQVGWKIGKQEIYRDNYLGAVLPIHTKFNDYKINSNITISPIWRRSSHVSLRTNGGKLTYNRVKYDVKLVNNKITHTKDIVKVVSSPYTSWSFGMDEGETLEYWAKRSEYSNFNIQQDGYFFQGWKSLRYNKVFKNFKDYKSEGYYDEIVAQWAKIGRDVNDKGVPYTDKGPFISELRLASAKNEKDAKKELSNAGFNVYFRDLNQDAGGNYIYLGYKMTNNREEAIRNIVVKFGKNSPNTISYGKEKNGIRPSYSVVTNRNGNKVDVNEKAGGEYIYIYTTKDERAGKPIKSLESFFVNTEVTGKYPIYHTNHPGTKTVATYRKNHFNGDTTVDFAPLVENNASSSKKSVANLNDGATKKKNFKKIFPYTSKSVLGLGFRRAKD